MNLTPSHEEEDLYEMLSPKQQAALDALLAEPTIAKAAQAAEVSERTLYRWIAEKEFARAYARARRQVFGQAVALTQRYAPLAVQTLAKLMMDATAPAPSRISAAATLLRFGREGIELDDLEQRVVDIESELDRRRSEDRRSRSVA